MTTADRAASARATWPEIKQWFDALVDVDVAERAARLEEVPAALRPDVARLLAFAESSGPLDQPPVASMNAEDLLPSWIGRRLGAFRVLREVGHGGMGTVYEGERADEQFVQRVAIKTLRIGTQSPDMQQRFRQERQILAQLQHPRIAALIDGGLDDSGVPYLVLEYVDGVPIDDWAAAHRLSLQGRIDLFRQVIDAVAAAHRQLIVHRDLKPSNILVDPDGHVKLVDFGIAKLLGPEPGLVTEGWHAFTTAYASPEQLSGAPVSTASDVYSLGLVLHHLLSGGHPFPDATQSSGAMLLAMRTQAPQAPSDAATAEAAEAMGCRTRARLQRSLRGELDAIVLTAIRSEPGRRYPSVEALGDDLGRYLRGRPVRARPDTLGYRVGKFVRRERAFVAAASLGVLALVSGTGVALWQAARARREAQHAALTSGFLRRVIGSADAGNTSSGPHLGPGATVAELLDSAAARMPVEFKDDARGRLDLHQTIGSAYLTQERFAEAASQFDSALALARQLDGPESESVAATFERLGETEVLRGDMRAGVTLMQRSRVVYQHLGDTLAVEYIRGLTNGGLALALLGDAATSESWLRRALRLARLRAPGPSVETAAAMAHLGGTLAIAGNRLDQADTLWVAALRMFDSLPGADVPEKGDALWYVAHVQRADGHVRTADSLNVVALHVLERAAGPMSQEVANHLSTMASDALIEGRTAGADSVITRAMAIVAARPECNPVIRDRVSLEGAAVRAAQGRLDEADSLARVTYQHRLSEGNSLYTNEAAVELGDVLRRERRFAAAEPLLLNAYRADSALLSPTHGYTLAAAGALIALYKDWHRADDAERYLARLPGVAKAGWLEHGH